MAKEIFLPYGHQSIDNDDIAAVTEALRSNWLTTGPMVEKFEEGICGATGSRHGVAVNSGTAAMHSAMAALDVGPGDEIIVPPITFAATANCVLYRGAKPVFADVDANALLIDPAAVEAAVTPRTKAIIAVDYAGQPCDWDALRHIAERHGLALVADSCHALGAVYKSRKVGTLADITVFSFHPVKHITTGEGGMAVTDNPLYAYKMRTFRNHGITATAQQREKENAWFYDMVELGYNYRITDFQCALGISQLKNLDAWLGKRNQFAAMYETEFANTPIKPLAHKTDVYHAYHLYVVKTPDRDQLFKLLREVGIGANVHYKPVYLHSYYQNLGYKQGLCPTAEAAYGEILTLPLWPGMDAVDVDRVITEIKKAVL